MGKYKISVNTGELYLIAINLFKKMGFESTLKGTYWPFLFAHNGKVYGDGDYNYFCNHKNNCVTIGELRALAEPVQKEYLQELEDGSYKLVVLSDVVDGYNGLIPVPEGADIAINLICYGEPSFYRYDFKEVFGCFDKCWKATLHTNENLAMWKRCKVLWERVKYDPTDINMAVGVDLDAIGKKLGCKGRLPWWSDDEYRKQLLIINDNGLKDIKDEFVVLGIDEAGIIGDFSIKGDVVVGFSLADGYVNAYDTQVGGNHYKDLAIQPMQYALANRLDYAQANVVKYVTRHALKNGKEDLLKAKHNIDLMIEHYYGEEK